MSVSKQIIEVLNDLCSKFGMAIDWSSENILPYVKELCGRFINYEIYTSALWMVLMSAICVIFWIVYATTFKSAKNLDWDTDYDVSWINEGSLICAIVLSIITIIVIMVQSFDIVEAIYLPEKTIYEFIDYQIRLHN